MEIKFIPLNTSNFPLLLKWLMTDHVRKWWDQDIAWTAELVAEKYASYTKGLKGEKPIHAYVFYDNETPIGYIQYYDIHDFPRDTMLPDNLPAKSAALDFYIGDSDYLHKGYGKATLKAFCEGVVWAQFDACFVDPESDNYAAIRGYESAGFKRVNTGVWMAKYRL